MANFTDRDLASVFICRWMSREIVSAGLRMLTERPSLLTKINERYDAAAIPSSGVVKIRVPRHYKYKERGDGL